MQNVLLSLILTVLVLTSCYQTETIVLDTAEDFKSAALSDQSLAVYAAFPLGGESDIMGNGALMLPKAIPDSLFALHSNFITTGSWKSKPIAIPANLGITELSMDILAYGKSLNLYEGWVKFNKNPVLSGSNEALPLNEDNITDETLLLPAPPGGLPQDQSIVMGTGKWKDKYILFFNHSPADWPRDYYWSFAVADSLSPLKQGINPFRIPEEHFPLVGPLQGHAPNDWIRVGQTYYAPDETDRQPGHMWISNDMISWEDIGEIKGKEGTDPGICFDGYRFHLFNEFEWGPMISHCFYDPAANEASENSIVADVGDHSGDCDVVFFNNQWHMFMDYGEHLHYHIAYAVTEPDSFPAGWKVSQGIYGPYNPDQGLKFDDDTEDGNRFGTGDADVMLEDNTLYMFTERPVGVAWKELTELKDFTDLTLRYKLVTFEKDQLTPLDSTEWIEASPGKADYQPDKSLQGHYLQLFIEMRSLNSNESPMIKKMEIKLSR